MKKNRVLLLTIFITLGGIKTLEAGFGDAVFGGIVGGVVSSALNGKFNYHSHHNRSTNIHRKGVLTISDPMKIQIALKNLGFYRASLDGKINSFVSRTAIKELNKAYNISDNAYLNPKERDILIYLGSLFDLDYHFTKLGSKSDKYSKISKIQIALKMLGFYNGKIDGTNGSNTKRAIKEYLSSKGIKANKLDYEQEYRLFDRAKRANDKNIQETIESLKHLGVVKQEKVKVQKKPSKPKPKIDSKTIPQEKPKIDSKTIPQDSLDFNSISSQRPTITLKKASSQESNSKENSLDK